ncbi:hypothetical protein [Legionella genomosp. 1]|uniref:hypothetical protein n=1 Tax=Legionella genomosp. 1 TaxID=1093625 RepID=UPI001056247E|nr:hypothetical protein [Legionella genomosp. 1]
MLTIFSAVIIFILSQFILRLILEPVIELKKNIGLISYTLLYFHSKLTNAAADNKISNEIKICSSKLLAAYSSIPFYSYLHKILYLPPYKDLLEASRNLNLIHAYMLEGHKEYMKSCNLKKPIHFPIEISKAMDKIGELLSITTTYQEKASA